VTIPGLTTTRLQLAFAAACLATGTGQGVAAAGLVLAVLAARLLLIHQHAGQLARLAPPLATTRTDTSRAVLPVVSPQAALTPGGSL
jgi:hypothetical protein